MCEHGRGLDGRTVARGRHMQSGELRLGRRRGVAYEAPGYKQGWADGRAGKTVKPTASFISEAPPTACLMDKLHQISVSTHAVK